jgi:hypothetical protein
VDGECGCHRKLLLSIFFGTDFLFCAHKKQLFGQKVESEAHGLHLLHNLPAKARRSRCAGCTHDEDAAPGSAMLKPANTPLVIEGLLQRFF